MTLNDQLHNSATHAAGSDPNCPVCVKRGRPVTVTAEKISWIVELRDKGATWPVIAEELNLSRAHCIRLYNAAKSK